MFFPRSFAWLGAVLVAGAAIAADFDGDGRQDLLWRTHAGNPFVWQMNGVAPAARIALSDARGTEAAIAANGDFFGGGSAAILWVDDANKLSLWRVVAGAVAQSCAFDVDPGWSFLGSGDIDRDGIDDVAWRLPDGSVDVFLMRGCSTPQTVALGATADPSWSFVGIGSTDAQSGALLWRDGSGDLILWRLHNGTSIFTNTLKAGVQASWSIAATGDFDGDGRSDILWRDPTGTQAAIWFLSGIKYTTAPVAAATPHVFAASDALFVAGFDSAELPSPALSASWHVLAAGDFDGDGLADIALADDDGDTAIWLMQGASVRATGVVPAAAGMPYSALDGWRPRIARPAITKSAGQVIVSWPAVAGPAAYVVYASAAHDPAQTGIAIATATPTLQFGRNDTGFADKRYFAVAARYLGVELPASPEAYLVEFAPQSLLQYGALPLADIDGDGCLDVLYALGDCHGNFQVLSQSAMGLPALTANGRAWRDMRYADLDGDGIDDVVASVYSDLGDAASHVLFFRGTGSAHFVEDAAFSALDIRGYGETMVIADFNGDGYLDIYLPQYSMNSPEEHSWLLLNDGGGHFRDVADFTGMASDPAANLALRAVPDYCRVEGAQAVDIDSDGRIDLYVGNHLFLNQGNDAGGVPHFLDTGPRVPSSDFDPASSAYYLSAPLTPSTTGLPQFHDEGAKFIDLDNSGQLALVLNSGASSDAGGQGIALYKYDGMGNFVDYSDRLPSAYMISVWGLTAADVDGDGLSDIILPGGCSAQFVPTPENPNCNEPQNPRTPPRLLVNRDGTFTPHDFYQDGLPAASVDWVDLVSAGDFDASGTPDVALRTLQIDVLRNQAANPAAIVVSVVGENGERNQAGRVVRVSPNVRPDIVMTQVVDGGSGYMTNGQYELLFPGNYDGAYTVTVRFAHATYTVTAHRGDHVTLRANGTYSLQ